LLLTAAAGFSSARKVTTSLIENLQVKILEYLAPVARL
jgi:hypothetical protein